MDGSEEPTKITLEVVLWRNDDGSIGLVVPDLQGSLVQIDDNPKRANGHPALHYVLAHCLRTAAVDAPAPKKRDADR